MAQTVCVIVSAEDRARLAAIIGDRSRPLKHMQRARIVLESADRLPALEISRRAGVSRPAVWRWQRHYAEEGVERLLREGSRKPGKAPVAMATVAAAVDGCGSTAIVRAVAPLRRVGRLLELGAVPEIAWADLESTPGYDGVAAAGRRCASSGARLVGAFNAVAVELRQHRHAAVLVVGH